MGRAGFTTARPKRILTREFEGWICSKIGMARRLRRLLSTKNSQFYENTLSAALLSAGLLAGTAVPVMATTSQSQTPSAKIVAIVQGVGDLEMWASVRRAAPQQAPSSVVVAALLPAHSRQRGGGDRDS